MSSTCDRGVLRPAYKARNMPKHFSITCQNWFHLVSVHISPLLYVTGTQAAVILESDEQIMCMSRWNGSDIAFSSKNLSASEKGRKTSSGLFCPTNGKKKQT